MTLKRSLDSTPLDGPTRKRRYHSASLPVTPNALLSTPLRTPRTPYPSRPSDSPGNPFGRKRTRHLTRTLPESTSFSKHLPLRFQFIRTGSNSSPRQGGVYRVVQVPLSYTFTHLRCLIAWLYRGLPDQTNRDEHLFEVQKDATTYSSLYKPGQVKSGQTWAKLSSSQNPYRYRKNYFNDDEEDTEEDELSSGTEGDGKKDDDVCEDEEFEDWKWEDEEEFTIGHAWPKGPDLERAIIYHHSLTTQVHITINQTTIPRRKGRSNTPYVFSARGRVWLSPPPLPRPIFAVKAKKLPSPVWRRKVSPKFTEVENWDDDSEDDDDDNDTEDVEAEVDPDYWNESSGAFAKFLTRYMASVLPISTPSPSHSMDNFDHEAEYTSDGDTLVYLSTPGLTRSSSIPSSPTTNLATSSPLTSSGMRIRIMSPSKSAFKDEEGYITLSLPAITPFPIKARPIRKRMERIEKRMGKLKKDKWLCQHDDKDEEENEDDELADDDDDEEKDTKINLGSRSVRDREDVPLDWDPFGDEEEL
ncbi:hypothetical protein Agabi119p4_9689 [Agaricus bisporus var. burnettii]|uniref:Uncharacterized protein n=1 Tax=Agaricus bisporus var. burnettii TaxID=192524 RepID=A0A8H7EX93_AGABI|nr:hypothetical protein Agabi119p4_9689 [Agaricus bisporus var. burnettii]